VAGELRQLPIEVLEGQVDVERRGVGEEQLPDRLEAVPVRLDDL
jgi:hypothetical protein